MIVTPIKDRKRSKTLVIVLFACLAGLCLLSIIGCLGSGATTGAAPTPQSATPAAPGNDPPAGSADATADENIAPEDLLTLIKDGSATVGSIAITPSDVLAIPPKVDLQIGGSPPGDIIVEVPCGLLLMPPVETGARLMVYQKAEALVPAGGSANVDLMVIPLEASKGVTATDGYTVGALIEGDLLILADCLCKQDVKAYSQTDDAWYTEILFATWSVSEDFPILFMQDNLDLYSAFTGGTPSCMETAIPKSLSILDTCGLPPGDPRTGTQPAP